MLYGPIHRIKTENTARKKGFFEEKTASTSFRDRSGSFDEDAKTDEGN
jgi:hypothetical protein